MKNAGILLLFVSASALLLTACASQGADTRYKGARRVSLDGVDYFCERPRPTGSQFIAPREQCYTEEQLKAIRDRDQEFVRRQQSIALQTNTTSVTRTAITP